jgi:hypothetical protein
MSLYLNQLSGKKRWSYLEKENHPALSAFAAGGLKALCIRVLILLCICSISSSQMLSSTMEHVQRC